MEDHEAVSLTETDLGTSDAPVPAWAIRFRRVSDGEFVHQLIPKLALTARAVEYGIDLDAPGGFELTLKMLLHETFADDQDDDEAGTDLFTAATIGDARDAHEARIASVQQRVRFRLDGVAGERVATRLRAARHVGADHPVLEGLQQRRDEARRAARRAGARSPVRRRAGAAPEPATQAAPPGNGAST